MALTLEQAKQKLQMWRDAEDAVATGKRYRIGTRELERPDLADIRKQIAYYENLIDRLESGRSKGARMMHFVVRDR